MKPKFAIDDLYRDIRVLLFALVLAGNLSISQNTQVTWYSFNMGYAEPNSGNTMIKSVVGQSIVGTTLQSNTQVISGFLGDTLFIRTVVGAKDHEQLPVSYALWQNYPNPFNPSTTIHFELPKETHVILKVYNMLGQEVVTALDEQKIAGRYEVRIDGSSLSSGVYFYRLIADKYIETKKLLLVR